eukprot:868835-Rhodomonas_salina.1
MEAAQSFDLVHLVFNPPPKKNLNLLLPAVSRCYQVQRLLLASKYGLFVLRLMPPYCPSPSAVVPFVRYGATEAAQSGPLCGGTPSGGAQVKVTWQSEGHVQSHGHGRSEVQSEVQARSEV